MEGRKRLWVGHSGCPAFGIGCAFTNGQFPAFPFSTLLFLNCLISQYKHVRSHATQMVSHYNITRVPRGRRSCDRSRIGSCPFLFPIPWNGKELNILIFFWNYHVRLGSWQRPSLLLRPDQQRLPLSERGRRSARAPQRF